MKFSEARKSHLAHVIVAAFRKEGLADIDNEVLVMREIKHLLDLEHVVDERIDAAARRKIASLSRHVTPGSSEWDILYRQYYEEEARKVRPRG